LTKNKAADPPLRRPADHDDADTPAAPARADGQPAGRVGDALRSVYQQTVSENVPDEMIDLLGRLD